MKNRKLAHTLKDELLSRAIIVIAGMNIECESSGVCIRILRCLPTSYLNDVWNKDSQKLLDSKASKTGIITTSESDDILLKIDYKQ